MPDVTARSSFRLPGDRLFWASVCAVVAVAIGCQVGARFAARTVGGSDHAGIESSAAQSALRRQPSRDSICRHAPRRRCER